MAALQQSPIALQSKSPPSKTSIFSKPPTRLSFSSTIPTLRIFQTTNSKPRGSGAAGARMIGTAAASYASAVGEIAKSSNTLESASADMEKIEKLFDDPSTFKFFLNPTIPVAKKREIVDEIGKSLDLLPYLPVFLNVLIDSNRIGIIKDIVKEFDLFYNKLTGTELAVVTSVVKLESQHLAQIAKGVQRLTGSKNVRIKTVIDPKLVAGFTIRYGSSGSKLVDMSVKKQLEEIASQLEFKDISLV